MKKLSILIVQLSLTVLSMGQDAVTHITLSPNGTYRLIKKTKFGSAIEFKIQNVNTFKITGHTVSKPFNIDFAAPTSFASISNMATGESNTPKSTNFSSSISTVSDDIARKTVTEGNASKFLGDIKSMLGMYSYSLRNIMDSSINDADRQNISSAYNQLKKDYEVIYNKYQQGTLRNKNLVNDVKKLQSQITVLNNTTQSLQSVIDSYNNQQRIIFNNTYTAFLKQYRLLGLFTSFENRLDKCLADSIFIADVSTLKENTTADFNAVYTTTHFATTANKSDKITLAKEMVLKTIDSIHSAFATLKTIYNQLPGRGLLDSIVYKEGELKSKDGNSSLIIGNVVSKLYKPKEFESEFTFSKKIYDQIYSDSIQKKIVEKAFAGIDLYNKIQKDSFTLYTGLEIVNADEKTITPTLKYANGKIAYEFNPITIKTRGGLKVNFSTGYLLSFIGDDNYGTYTNDTGRVVGVTRAASNKVSSALGVLAHAYLRTASNMSVGLSSGFSVNTDANLGFYLGASGFFFENNRLVLTAGYSLTQKQTLNKSNLKKLADQRGSYEFINLNSSIPVYDKLYKGALFLGMTFNILKNN